MVHGPSTAHPSLPTSANDLQEQVTANLALAQHLSNLESDLLKTRDHVSAHLISVRALEARWRKAQTQLETRLEPWGPRELHQRLVVSIGEQENLCRGVEESFVDDDAAGTRSEREVNEWIKRVREGRKILHLRQERRRRWDEGRVGGWR